MSVMLAIGGHTQTLRTILDAVNKDTPVVVLSNSGGACTALSEMHQMGRVTSSSYPEGSESLALVSDILRKNTRTAGLKSTPLLYFYSVKDGMRTEPHLDGMRTPPHSSSPFPFLIGADEDDVSAPILSAAFAQLMLLHRASKSQGRKFSLKGGASRVIYI